MLAEPIAIDGSVVVWLAIRRCAPMLRVKSPAHALGKRLLAPFAFGLLFFAFFKNRLVDNCRVFATLQPRLQLRMLQHSSQSFCRVDSRREKQKDVPPQGIGDRRVREFFTRASFPAPAGNSLDQEQAFRQAFKKKMKLSPSAATR